MGTKRNQRKRNRRLQIIDAAIKVIAQHGYHSAKMTNIAAEAGVADGTIYNYFESKEQVLICIFEEKMTELIAQATLKINAHQSPVDKVRAFVRNHFEHLQRNPELGKVFQVELRQSQQFFHGYRPKKLFEYLDLLGSAIREGQRAGIFRSHLDSMILQWSIFGTLDELSINWVMSEQQWPPDLDTVPEQVLEIFLLGIESPLENE